MATHHHSTGPSLLAYATLWAPWAVALAALAVFGLLDPLHAILAGLVAALFTYVALRVRVRRTDSLVDYLETLAEDGDAAPPPSDSLAMHAVERAVGRLARAQARRTGKIETRLASVETILEGLPDPLIVLDAGRRVIRANTAARDLAGSEMTDRDLSVGLRDPDLLDAVDEVLAGAPGRDIETTVTAPMKRQLSARIEPLAPGPEDAAAILLLHDVTEMKDMERMRADFVANASHELRTPITALIGFVETLKGPARDDAEGRARFLDLMQEQATRMARLVNDLLSLSRIELNVHAAPTDPVHPIAVLRRIRDLLDMEARLKGMDLRLSAPEGDPPSGDGPAVIGDEEEMTQLFQNLISNAVKYGAEGTPVDIEVALAEAPLPPAASHIEGTALRIEIRDRGEGIAPEHIPRLTERFYRVDTARSRSLGGTGLGLAIVKHIVNRHRGALTIASRVGEGSRFAVYLPLAPHTEAATVTKP